MAKITKFRDIKQFPHCCYHVDVSWENLENHIKADKEEIGLDLDPDFQRAHIWTPKQQIAYCEYILRNGSSGRELYFNCAKWLRGFNGPYVIVDGKQRVEAVRSFMAGRIPVFGSFYGDYKDGLNMLVARFSWNIAALETREEVLNWYLDFNSGGSVHTEAELQKVRDLLKK